MTEKEAEFEVDIISNIYEVIMITHLFLLITPLIAGCDTPKTLAVICGE
jgi:hypothetical protein